MLSARLEFRLAAADFQQEHLPFLRSPAQRLGNCYICMKVYPRGLGFGAGRAVSVFFEILPDVLWSREWQFPDINFSITAYHASDSSRSVMRALSFSFGHSQSNRGWYEFLPSAGHEALAAAGWLTPDGQLLLSASVKGDLGRSQPFQSGLWGTRLMWAERRWADMTVSSDEEDERIPCHRAVLANVSEIFDRMLGGDLQEATERHVVFHGVSTAVVHAFIAYIYTDALPPGVDVVALLQLADMYDIPSLAEACVWQLKELARGPLVLQVVRLLSLQGRQKPHHARLAKELLEYVSRRPAMLRAVAGQLAEEGDLTFLRGLAQRVLSSERFEEALVRSALTQTGGPAAVEAASPTPPRALRESLARTSGRHFAAMERLQLNAGRHSVAR